MTSGFRKVKTSAEVWAVLRARHSDDMELFSSFSDPTGSMFGRSNVGRMETEWAMRGAGGPMLAALTTWDIDPEQAYKRINEKHEYWLCFSSGEEE